MGTESDLPSEQLRKELEQAARFPDMNPGPVLRVDYDGTILLSNIAAHSILGNDLKGKNWIEMNPDLDENIWKEIINNESVSHVECEIGDSFFRFDHRTDPEFKLVFVFGTDITINKQNARQLEEQKATIAEIARFPDMNPGPVLRVNFDGDILLSNVASESILGSDLKGKNWVKMNPDLDEDIWKEIINNENVSYVECAIGDKFYRFDHKTDPKFSLVFVFGSDITTNKENARKLEEQKAVIEEIARFPDMNPGPVLRTNFNGNILLSNAAAKELFGEDLKGKCWRDICPHVSAEIWDKILSSETVVAVEAQAGDKYLMFKHRADIRNNFVFIFGMDITLQRLAESQLRQSEKMATLGTLAAGVAHEINNPAAANKRAAQQLRELLAKIDPVREKLYAVQMSQGEMDFIRMLAQKVNQPDTAKLSSMDSFNKESILEDWLEDYGIDEPWDIAPSLITIGMNADQMKTSVNGLNKEAVIAIINYISMLVPIYELTGEIFEATSRITEIVGALKNYSFLGEAPVQKIDLHKGIDNTLVILKNKIKEGIEVRKEYAQDLPEITAYGSELNQVWTNLLDNAADALDGTGTIIIRTFSDSNNVTVEIEDDGPGIPKDVQSRVFDPFFTTKELGKGTGLGLSTSYGIIVEKHKGSLTVESNPGKTTFTIVLPLELK